MEFPAGALTSLRAIDGFLNIYWRIYSCMRVNLSEPAVTKTTNFQRLGELRGLELALRNRGYLVSPLLSGDGLWIFSSNSNFDSLGTLCGSHETVAENAISVDNMTLHNAASGVIATPELLKCLASEPQSSVLATSSPQKYPNADNGALGPHSFGTYSAFYEAFISAVAGAISLRLAQHHLVIPLGIRTLYSAIDKNGYESGTTTVNYKPGSTSLLTTLDIEVAAKGTLVVFLRTLPQHGLAQLSPPFQPEIDTPICRPNEDLWLAPHGIVGRFISADGNEPNMISPNTGAPTNEVDDSILKREANQREWKFTVSEWLQKSGLTLNDPDTEPWIEVDVVEPIDGNSQGNVNQMPVSPFRRILWPAKFCFKRSRSNSTTSRDLIERFFTKSDDPLRFAERWLSGAPSRNETLDEKKLGQEANVLDSQQTKLLESPRVKTEAPDILESLARTINYPDFQSASAVYPTPPGGALPHGLGTMVSSESLAIASGDGLTYGQIQSEPIGSVGNLHGDSALLMPSRCSQLVVGSGLYDTAGDEDLFEEMDAANFGAKGLTEPDFSFFDEPDFADLHVEMDSEAGRGVHIQDRFDSTESVPTSSQPLGATLEPTVAILAQGNKRAMDGSTGADSIGQDAVTLLNMSLEDNAASTSIGELKSHAEKTHSDGNRRPPMSPPLSPMKIKSILFSKEQFTAETGLVDKRTPSHGLTKPRRMQSHYDPVSFQQNLRSSDRKYRMDGKFWFIPEKGNLQGKSKSTECPSDIPTVGFPERAARVKRHLPRLYKPSTSDPSFLERRLEAELQSPSPSSDESNEDSNDSSDELSDTNALSNYATGLKRKRVDDGDSTSSSLEKLTLSAELETTGSKEDYATFLPYFLSGSSGWSLAGYFSMKETNIPPSLTRREDSVHVAQLMVDQITQSSLRHRFDGLVEFDDVEGYDFLSHSAFDDSEVMGQLSRLDLRTYATLEDIAGSSHPRKDPTHAIRPNLSGSISRICPPHVRVRRGGSYLEAFPPAIAFWETFGLEPLNREKDIIPFCIYPRNIKDEAEAFLERLGLVYSSSNFGKHSRSNDMNVVQNGLIPWNLNASGDHDYPSVIEMLRTTCETLGSAVSNLPPSNENVVIYVINPFSHGGALADICSAFLRLFHKYVEDSSKPHSRQLNELVLQIVPIGFVASSKSLVVPSQVDYLRLALEVYTRCPPKDQSSDWLYCAPPVVIVEPIPKVVPFSLASDGASPLEEGKCLHIAYSQSLDQRWITAAWSDNTGRYQMSLSYCLRGKGSAISRPIAEVRQQIWETTRAIMEMSHHHWRVLLVKNEPVDIEEAEGMVSRGLPADRLITAWISLVDRHNQGKAVNVELTIITAIPRPGLFLKLPSSQLQLSAFSQQTTQLPSTTTPVSTPRPSAPSPDPSGSAPTPPTVTSSAPNAPTPRDEQQQQPYPQQLVQQPSVDSDTDTILIDKSDESWALILSHRLNNSPSLTTYSPALASGYLIRRSGTSDTDGLASMSVNIIHSHVRRLADVLLKDILRMYRDLATLARARGIAHVQGNYSLPWHIATAVKGQEILSHVL